MNGGVAITNVNTRWNSVELRSGATRTLRGNITVVTQGDLNINSGSKLVIDGNVKLVVFGNLTMDLGAIELKSGAKLAMYVRGSGNGDGLRLRDGYIGNLRANTTRDATGESPYMDAERLQIFSTPPSGSPSGWRIEGNTVVKASIYAPDPTGIEIREQSALYGRVATTALRLKDSAAIFYDPALNCHAGYTDPTSAIWDDSGRMKPAISSLTSLDSNIVQTLADTLNAVVVGLLRTTKYTPASGDGSTSSTVAPTDPTPRPIAIQCRITAIGASVATWE